MVADNRSPLVRLECPNCASPIDQYNATSQSTICGTCGSHISLGLETSEILSKGSRLPKSPRPFKIGDMATIANVDYMVLGRVVYRGVEDGETFTWNEWQLGGENGQMLWLSLDEKGFGLFRKIRFRQPFNARHDFRLELGDKTAFIHERYGADILGAEGELTWRARPGTKLFFAEGAGNGLKYSIQQTAHELEIHEGREVSEIALAKAFRNKEWLDKVQSLEQWKTTYTRAAIACVIAGIIGLVLALYAGTTGVQDPTQRIELSDNDLSSSFALAFESQRPAIVSIRLIEDSLPENSFIDVDVNIVSPDGLSQPLFVQELWHETGVDEDGRWVETQYKTSEMFVPTQSGKHELEVAYDGSVLDDLTLEVTVRRDHIMPLWYIVYTVLAFIGAAVFGLSASSQQLPSS